MLCIIGHKIINICNSLFFPGLTQEKIIEAVNVIKQSPHFGHNFDYSKLLGDITRDEQTGQIISAKSALHVWVGSINASDLSENGKWLKLKQNFEQKS